MTRVREMNSISRSAIAAGTIMMMMIAAAATPAIAECQGGNFNEPSGFRGIPWGTPLSSLGIQMKLDPTGGGNLYRRTNDKLMLGDVPLVKVLYHFHRGTFGSAFLKSAPETDTQMIAAFKAQFGLGYCKNNPYIESY
ncbi:MAG: hypothetical protein WA728_16985, partial [Xanthobacteraceae bacterium]